MAQYYPVIAFWAVIVVVVFGAGSIFRMMKTYLATAAKHSRSLDQIDESLRLSRRAVELQEQTNALLRELVDQQK